MQEQGMDDEEIIDYIAIDEEEYEELMEEC